MFETVFMSLVMAAVFVFPAYLFSSMITGSPKRNQKAVAKAIERHHVVTATLIKAGPLVFDVPGVTAPGPHRRGVYEYTYKGRRYKYYFWANNPPSRLTLYFLKNPKKATVDKALFDSETSWMRIYLIIAGLLITLNLL